MLDRTRTNIFDDDAPTAVAAVTATAFDQAVDESAAAHASVVFKHAAEDVGPPSNGTVDRAAAPDQATTELDTQEAIAAHQAPLADAQPARDREPAAAMFDVPVRNEDRRPLRRAPRRWQAARAREPRPKRHPPAVKSAMPASPKLAPPSLRLPTSPRNRVLAAVAAVLILTLLATVLAALFGAGDPRLPSAEPRRGLGGAIFEHPGPPLLPARPFLSDEERQLAELRRLRARLRAARARANQLARRGRRARVPAFASTPAPVGAQRAPTLRPPSVGRPPSVRRPAPSGRRAGRADSGAEFTVEG